MDNQTVDNFIQVSLLVFLYFWNKMLEREFLRGNKISLQISGLQENMYQYFSYLLGCIKKQVFPLIAIPPIRTSYCGKLLQYRFIGKHVWAHDSTY